MIPWLIFAIVVVPLAIVAFVAVRRRNAAGERFADEGEADDFAAAEAYQDEWREEDKERFHREHLP